MTKLKNSQYINVVSFPNFESQFGGADLEVFISLHEFAYDGEKQIIWAVYFQRKSFWNADFKDEKVIWVGNEGNTRMSWISQTQNCSLVWNQIFVFVSRLMKYFSILCFCSNFSSVRWRTLSRVMTEAQTIM